MVRDAAKSNDRNAAKAKRRAPRRVRLKIQRRDGPDEKARWEHFEVPYTRGMTVISALRRIERKPATAEGKRVAPVAFEANCLEGTCGSCTMIIDRQVRLACASFVDELSPKGRELTIEPLGKFPLVRDLVVDRSRLFDDYRRVEAWVELAESEREGPVPPESSAGQQQRLALSSCVSCGCCLEACPQYRRSGPFVGAAAIHQVRLLGLHRLGTHRQVDRIDSLMRPGGIADCGKAHVCVRVCPKDIPLDESVAVVARQATRRLLRGWLLRSKR